MPYPDVGIPESNKWPNDGTKARGVTQIKRLIREGCLGRFVKTNEKERLTTEELLERDRSQTPRRRL
ncbi:hypothetical protein CR513_29738, partial [Mucuna pruriens]